MSGTVSATPLGWLGIVRLGLVQSAIGAIVMLATSLLNRVMVVEYALPAALPAGLVAWHYAVQLSRPAWGHGSDRGRRRTPWIIAGMATLAAGAMLAVGSVALIAGGSWTGYLLAVVAFAMIGAGGVAGGAFVVAVLAIRGMEGAAAPAPAPALAPITAAQAPSFEQALRDIWSDRDARRFTVFVFLSMLAYSMQDLILEPFAGLLFGLTPGQSTQLSGTQHGGVLLGMVTVGLLGSLVNGRTPGALRRWTVGGCIGSAVALGGLAVAASAGPGWPLAANVALLGFANGVFAVAAIGTMMELAGSGDGGQEGIRMGVWGAAQAVAFGSGGLIGAVSVDLGRWLIGSTPDAFTIVFAIEASLFLLAAPLAWRRIAHPANARPIAGLA